MKYIYLFFLLIFSISCSKPKTVLICGDHICVNKAEAEQYFEENLTIEVKIIDQKVESEIDLVELNLTDSKNGKSINHKVEINKEGEFIDIWPEGFFEERFVEMGMIDQDDL